MNVFVTSEGHKFFYHELREGRTPLLFIHGLGCASSSDYPSVVASCFYPKCKSLLIDLIGAGFSDKSTGIDYSLESQVGFLTEFVNHWPDRKFSLFGHSAGALIALELAQRMGDRVESLILCEPGINKYGLKFLANMVAMPKDEFVATGFDKTLDELREGANAAWAASFSVCSADALYQWAQSVLEENYLGWAERFKALELERKAVIISDKTADRGLPFFIQLGCAVERVSNSSHLIMHDNPDGLAMAISNILLAEGVGHESRESLLLNQR